jgi:hypothetical protein
MKKAVKNNNYKSKLFNVGLASTLCSGILAIVFSLYANLFFKPQYYRSLSPSEQTRWWNQPVNLVQASELLRAPVAQILLLLIVCTLAIGLCLMKIAITLGSKEVLSMTDKEIEQWLQEQEPQRKRKRRKK